MIVITKKEKDYLESQGCVFGHDIHKTRTRYKKYFLTETNKNIELLNRFREESKYVSNNVGS